MIDVFNRTIFDQLGFHDAFITHSFETRFVLHFLFPFCYVNAINAAKHFNRKVYGEGNTKALLLELFSKRWRATRSGWPPSLDLWGWAWRRRRALHARGHFLYGGVRGHARVSIRGGPPSRESPGKHVLIPLKDIEGYQGFEPCRT